MEDSNKKPEIDAQKKEIRKKQKQVLFLFADAALEFAFLIGGPLAIFAFLGKKYGWMESKAYTIIGVLTALLISGIAVGKRIKDFRDRLK